MKKKKSKNKFLDNNLYGNNLYGNNEQIYKVIKVPLKSILKNKNYDRKNYDVAILLVNHRKYKNIYTVLKNNCKILIDLFNFCK